jgi:prephenate dehydrogenase
VKVAVLGVGLIGGSIGLAARRRAGARVSGYDPDPEAGGRALQRGALDSCASTPAEAMEEADVVFLAAPVGAIPAMVQQALQLTGSDCVVSDVGSTKSAIVAAGRAERFIGGHPLAGAETAGVEHARAELFEGATWYLTPTQGTTGVLYERLHRLLAGFGAQPTAIAADAHDRLMASVSHLPHVLANVLVAQATHALQDEARLPATGPSFRDATRVAGANSGIWTDIYLSNHAALGVSIRETIERLGEVSAMLERGDAEALVTWNERARGDHAALLGAALAGDGAGEGGPAIHELRASVPNRPGVIAEIALALGGAGVNILDMALSPSPDNSQGVVALWLRGEEHLLRAQALIDDLGFPVARA